MEVTFKGRHISIPDNIKEYIEKKLAPIERHLENIDNVNVVVSTVKNTTSIEITVNARGIIIRAQEQGMEWRDVVDDVVEKLESQIRKYKGKKYDKFRKGYESAFLEETEEEIEEEEEIKIDKVKEFTMKPMSPEEAILQMELLGHNFYVFRDADTDKINVVYKRKNGGYGLIITN